MLQDTPVAERVGFKRGADAKVQPRADHPRAKREDRAKGRHPAGPYSRWLVEGGNYNGSSREGRFLNMCRKELEDHLGGNLTVAQKILVERICFLRLRAALFDEKFLEEGKPLGELDYRVYLAISNSLVRATRELGVGRRNGSKPSLPSLVAAMNGAADEL